AYSELSSVEIIYTKKTRLSPFDINPDYFYLMVNYNEKSIKLDFDSSVKDFLPQFVSFLSRKNIPVIDNSNVTDLIISGTSLYEHFNETAN
ncbi:XRE family transcriptional regulator, partial [Enterococcus faecalis]|nr:XRE family transcriptional regulator [Enterococcus faecalis]